MEKLLLLNIIILKIRVGLKDKLDKLLFRIYSIRRDNIFIKISYINNINV